MGFYNGVPFKGSIMGFPLRVLWGSISGSPEGYYG